MQIFTAARFDLVFSMIGGVDCLGVLEFLDGPAIKRGYERHPFRFFGFSDITMLHLFCGTLKFRLITAQLCFVSSVCLVLKVCSPSRDPPFCSVAETPLTLLVASSSS